MYHQDINDAYKYVPQGSIGYGANNVYKNFPPLMSDGRASVAGATPSADMDVMMQKNSGITANWQYRSYLQKNANAILAHNFAEANNDVGFIQRNTEPSMGAPYLYKDVNDNTDRIPQINNDLKQWYLSREQLDSSTRPQGMFITQQEFLNWKNQQIWTANNPKKQ